MHGGRWCARNDAFPLDDGLLGVSAPSRCVETAQGGVVRLLHCVPCAPNFVIVIDTWVRLSGVSGHRIATAPGGGSSPHPGESALLVVTVCLSTAIYHFSTSFRNDGVALLCCTRENVAISGILGN